jgi:hypothetical protein
MGGIYEKYYDIGSLEDRLCYLFRVSGGNLLIDPPMTMYGGIHSNDFCCTFILHPKLIYNGEWEHYIISFIYEGGDHRLYNFLYDSLYSRVRGIDERYIMGMIFQRYKMEKIYDTRELF